MAGPQIELYIFVKEIQTSRPLILKLNSIPTPHPANLPGEDLLLDFLKR